MVFFDFDMTTRQSSFVPSWSGSTPVRVSATSSNGSVSQMGPLVSATLLDGVGISKNEEIN